LAKIPALDALCLEAKAHFRTKMAAVTLLTEDIQLLMAREGIDADQTPRGVAFCNYTILEDAVFVVLDAPNDPRFSDNPLTTGFPFIRFYAGAPLIYLTGLRIGAFCLLDRRARHAFTNGERAELVDFADRAMQILVSRLGRSIE
jgi:GAF domain-containing protein